MEADLLRSHRINICYLGTPPYYLFSQTDMALVIKKKTTAFAL